MHFPLLNLDQFDLNNFDSQDHGGLHNPGKIKITAILGDPKTLMGLEEESDPEPLGGTS